MALFQTHPGLRALTFFSPLVALSFFSIGFMLLRMRKIPRRDSLGFSISSSFRVETGAIGLAASVLAWICWHCYLLEIPTESPSTIFHYLALDAAPILLGILACVVASHYFERKRGQDIAQIADKHGLTLIEGGQTPNDYVQSKKMTLLEHPGTWIMGDRITHYAKGRLNGLGLMVFDYEYGLFLDKGAYRCFYSIAVFPLNSPMSEWGFLPRDQIPAYVGWRARYNIYPITENYVQVVSFGRQPERVSAEIIEFLKSSDNWRIQFANDAFVVYREQVQAAQFWEFAEEAARIAGLFSIKSSAN